jgi:hypothetical protein
MWLSLNLCRVLWLYFDRNITLPNGSKQLNLGVKFKPSTVSWPVLHCSDAGMFGPTPLGGALYSQTSLLHHHLLLYWSSPVRFTDCGNSCSKKKYQFQRPSLGVQTGQSLSKQAYLTDVRILVYSTSTPNTMWASYHVDPTVVLRLATNTSPGRTPPLVLVYRRDNWCCDAYQL